MEGSVRALPVRPARLLRAAWNEGAPQERQALLTSGRDDLPYEELERVAVLENDSEPDEEESAGPTWSLRPEGVFVRDFVHDYTRVTVQMYYPEWHRVRWDTLGRIVLVEIADPDFENVPRPFRRPMYLAGVVR